MTEKDNESAPGSSKQAPPTAFMQGITAPGKLEIKENTVENWRAYKQVWNNYSIITNLSSQTEKYRVALFLHCIGTDTLKVYNGLDFENEEDKTSLEKIMEKFEQYTFGETNETYERLQFNNRKQEEHESFDSFVTALHNLARTCNFCECLYDSLIRDQIVIGIRDQRTRQRLLQERKLKLKKCIDICRSSESATTQMKAITTTTTNEVHKVKIEEAHGNRGKFQQRSRYDRNASTGNKTIRCFFCAENHPAQKEKCPAWGEICTHCGGRNHFSKACKKGTYQQSPRKVNEIHGTSEYHGSDDSDVEFISGIIMAPNEKVNTIQSGYLKEIYTEMIVEERKVQFQVDSGASTNILPAKYIKDAHINPTHRTLRMWNGSEVKPLGTTRIVVRNPKSQRKFSIEFVVVAENLTPLIGAKAAQHMGLITIHVENFVKGEPPKTRGQPEIKSLKSAEQLTDEYTDIFERKLGDSSR